MTAVDLYLSLALATAISVLVSLSAHRPVRMLRNVTVLLGYVLLVALFFVDPWWRVAAVWSLAGLVTGLICFMVDCAWNRQIRESPGEPCPPTHWWLIPLGLLGWPDMLPQTIEMVAHDRRVFRYPTARYESHD